MRIQVMDIGPAGLPIDEALDQPWIEQALAADLPTPFHAVAGARLAGKLNRIGGEVLVDLRLDLQLQAECASCLKTFSLALPVHLRQGLKPRPRRRDMSAEERELSAQELEEAYYENDVVDLEAVVREHILLTLPMFPKCAEDCRGLCPACGTDLNGSENCDCQVDDVDPRLAALKEIKLQRG